MSPSQRSWKFSILVIGSLEKVREFSIWTKWEGALPFSDFGPEPEHVRQRRAARCAPSSAEREGQRRYRFHWCSRFDGLLVKRLSHSMYESGWIIDAPFKRLFRDVIEPESSSTAAPKEKNAPRQVLRSLWTHLSFLLQPAEPSLGQFAFQSLFFLLMWHALILSHVISGWWWCWAVWEVMQMCFVPW